MKTFTKIVALALLVVMTLTLVACSSYGAILKNFEKDGWVELKDEENKTVNTIVAELENGNLSCTVHFLQKEAGLIDKSLIILEFASDEALTEAIGESGTLKGMIQDAQNSKYVRGNCILLPLLTTLLDQDVVDLFNEGK